MNNCRKKIHFLLIFLSFGFSFLSAQTVVIKGNASDYYGDKIIFYTFSDQITHLQEELGSCTVNKTGDFLCTFFLDETREIYTNLGIYNGYLYVEPGLTYEIKLPPKVEKTVAQLLNPYFTASEIHLGVVNYEKKELNYLIRTFNDAYDPVLNRYAFLIQAESEITDLDSMLNSFQKPYRDIQHSYFNSYKKFRLELLKHITYTSKSVSMSKSDCLGYEILYNNPAYMDLFNQIFYKFFNYLIRSRERDVISYNINTQQSITSLRETVCNTGMFSNDSLVELVILKGIYDELYSNTFSKEALLTVLDSLLQTTNIPENRKIAANIKYKVTKLMKGYTPPDFKLFTLDSVQIELNDLKGRYVYLNFCTSLNYTCLNHFEMLKRLFQNYHEYLNIVTILVYEDPEKARKFIEEKDYEWLFLSTDNRSKILREYDVKALPTYYLLDPEGKMIMSPALSPTENFEEYLKRLLTAEGK